MGDGIIFGTDITYCVVLCIVVSRVFHMSSITWLGSLYGVMSGGFWRNLRALYSYLVGKMVGKGGHIWAHRH